VVTSPACTTTITLGRFLGRATADISAQCFNNPLTFGQTLGTNDMSLPFGIADQD
jgi:hypothetical protein